MGRELVCDGEQKPGEHRRSLETPSFQAGTGGPDSGGRVEGGWELLRRESRHLLGSSLLGERTRLAWATRGMNCGDQVAGRA